MRITHAKGREGLRRNLARKGDAEGRQGPRHDQESIECQGFNVDHHTAPLRQERKIVRARGNRHTKAIEEVPDCNWTTARKQGAHTVFVGCAGRSCRQHSRQHQYARSPRDGVTDNLTGHCQQQYTTASLNSFQACRLRPTN